MNINKLNDDYLNELLDKLSKENKTILLIGDFNINLLNYNIHPRTNEFLDSLSSHYFLLHFLQPIVSISDALPQFLVAHNIFLMPLTLNAIITKETGQDLTN